MAHAWVNVTYLKRRGLSRRESGRGGPQLATAPSSSSSRRRILSTATRRRSQSATRCVAVADGRRRRDACARRRSIAPAAVCPLEPLGGSRRGHLSGVRGMGAAQGRARRPPARLLQPQPDARPDGHSDRAQTTASSRAVPTTASRRTSRRAGSTACSPSACPRISARGSSRGRSSANGQTTSCRFWLNPPYWIWTSSARRERQRAAGDQVRRSTVRRLTGPAARHRPDAVGAPSGGRSRSGCGRPICRRQGRARRRNWPPRGQRPSRPPPPVAIVGGQVVRRRARRREPRTARPDITVIWKLYRGPGRVTSRRPRSRWSRRGDPKTVPRSHHDRHLRRARRVHPARAGERRVGRGGGGDQCCWTTALVGVTVK